MSDVPRNDPAKETAESSPTRGQTSDDATDKPEVLHRPPPPPAPDARLVPPPAPDARLAPSPYADKRPDPKSTFSTPNQSPSMSIFSKKSSEATPRQDNTRGHSNATIDDFLDENLSTYPAGSGDHDEDEARSLGDLSLPSPKHPSKCPLFCCFYAEFDIKVGPKVCYQSPQNFMEQEIDLSLEQVHEILADTFRELQVSHADLKPKRSDSKATDENKKTSSEKKPSVDDKGSRETDEEASQDGSFSIFDSCSEYIITGNELSGNIVNLSTHHFHVLTRPTIISDERFERNSLFFCIGFVLRRTEDPRPFRPVLSKVALALRDMEIESHFLSSEKTRPQIQTFLEKMLVSLNSPQWECNIALDPANVLNVKLFHPPKLPAVPVPDYAVPVLLRRDWQVQTYDWDLSINWVLMHIDGVTNARQISLKAEIDMEMVRACLRVLKHHGLIALVDMFFFSNRYEATSKAAAMIAGKQGKLLNDAVDFVIKQKKTPGAHQERDSPPLQPSSPDIGRSPPSLEQFSSSYLEHREAHQMGMSQGGMKMASLSSNYSHEMPAVSHRREEYAETKAALAELYCACNRSSSVGEVWIGLVSGRPLSGTSTSTNWRKIFNLIDHRRFTLFGLVHGLLRRVHNFPLLLDQPFTSDSSRSLLRSQELATKRRHERSRSGVRSERNMEDKRQLALRVASMMDGRHCDDELVCVFQRPLEDLLELVEGKRVVHVYAKTALS